MSSFADGDNAAAIRTKLNAALGGDFSASGTNTGIPKPGAIGGTTPAAGTFTTVATSKGTFTSAAVTGGFPTAAADEVLLSNTLSGGNTQSVLNSATDGYSAYTARSSTGYEKFAAGWGNASVGAGIFANAAYLQTWTGEATGGTLPDFKITHDGDYGAIGSGFRFYQRITLSASNSDFDIWRLIPFGTTQESVLSIPAGTGVATFAPNVASDAMIIRNRSSSGYSTQVVQDHTGAPKLFWGWANTSAATNPGTLYFQAYNGGSTPPDMKFGNFTGGFNLCFLVRGDTCFQFGSGIVKTTRVVTAAGAVTVAVTDHIVVVNKTVGAATTVNLPASPATGLTFVIKDGKRDAGANNITITPAAGNIEGAGTLVISTNGQGKTIFYSGSEWLVEATT